MKLKKVVKFFGDTATLIMLISAYAGRDAVLAAYNEAIVKGYRFYSFGDAMFILDNKGIKRKEEIEDVVGAGHV